MVGRGSAIGAEAAERHIVLRDEEPVGKLPSLVVGLRKLDIGHLAAVGAVEVAVFAEICAEAGRFPVDMDGFDQAVADHRLEAIVDRGERDRRHPLLGTDKDFRGRGMVPLVHQHLVDLTPLGSEPQALSPHRVLIGWNG